MIASSQRSARTTTASPVMLYAAVAFGLVYLAVLAIVSGTLPLRANEILPLYTFQTGSWHDSSRWIAMIPGSTAGFSFSQWPIVITLGHSPLVARIVSIACAVASLAVLWRIAKFAGIRMRLAVLIIFALLPVQFMAASTARAPEESVFLLLLATLFFLRLSVNPSVGKAVAYAVLLTATIYTDAFSYVPALGYLLFFFRFVARPVQRKAIWFALPGTIIPLLAYLPYYQWSAPKVLPTTLPPATSPGSIAGQVWQGLAGNGLAGTAVLIILLIATVAALWPSFQPRFPVPWSNLVLRRNMAIFVLFGGALACVCFSAGYASATFTPVTTAEVLAVVPVLAVLSIAACEYFVPGRATPIFASILVAVLVAGSVLSDVNFTQSARTPDLQALADAAWGPLTASPDSCVVFVSEGLSRPLFFVLSPKLQNRECRNFFHKTVVLEIHPYVTAPSRDNALTFFRGLGFQPQQTKTIGNGSVITMTQKAAAP